MKISNYILLGFLLLVITPVMGQRNLEKGDRYFDLNMFDDAMKYYIKEMEGNGPRKAKNQAMVNLANTYRLLGRFEEAEALYKKIMRRKKRDPQNTKNYGLALKASAKYAEAKAIFLEYKEANPADPMSDTYIKSCDIAQSWLDQTVGSEVKNMTMMNTEEADFSPFFFGDTLLFSSSRRGSVKKLISFNGDNVKTLLDFYAVDLHYPAEQMPPPRNYRLLNTYLHEGPGSFTPDHKRIYFTRTVEGKKDKKENVQVNTLQIFYRDRSSNGQWSESIFPFEWNNENYSTGQPSVSADGNSLYFISNMEGGYGGTDIYVCHKKSNGSWGNPQNLGPEINTFGFELFPFISADGKLYFSSNVHPGMGKLDIFSSTYKDGNWGKVENLKPPLNSIADDFGFAVHKDGNKGFFSSNRFNGVGSDDIYSFIFIAPTEVAFEAGEIVIDDNTLYDGKKFKLVNDKTKEQIILEPKEGKFRFPVKEGDQYTLKVRKDGFSYNKIAVEMERDTEEELQVVTITPKKRPIIIKGKLKEKIEYTETVITVDSAGVEHVQKVPAIKNVAVEGVKVELLKNDSSITSEVTRGEGAYEFKKELEPKATYKMIAKKGQKKLKLDALTVKGKVKSDDKPVKNAELIVYLDNKPISSLRTGNEGEYEIVLDRYRKYEIGVKKDGYDYKQLKYSTEGNLGKLEYLDIILKAKDYSHLGDVKLAGFVKENQKPIAQSKIKVYVEGELVNTSSSGDFGEYEVILKRGNEYEIKYSKSGYSRDSIFIRVFESAASEINKIAQLTKNEIPEKEKPKSNLDTVSTTKEEPVVEAIEEEKDLNFSETKKTTLLTLSGVIASQDGALDSVSIDIYKDDKLVSLANTDASGKYEATLETGSKYELALNRKGYKTDTLELDLTSQDKIDAIEMTLSGKLEPLVKTKPKPQKVVLSGLVAGSNGPLDSVQLNLIQGNQVVNTKSSNKSGQFFIDIEKGDEYQLLLSKDGFTSDTVKIDFTSEEKIKETQQTLSKALQLKQIAPAKILVQGLVKNGSKALDSVSIDFYANDKLILSQQTNELGVFDAEIEKDSQYAMVLSKPGFLPDTVNVDFSTEENIEKSKQKLSQLNLKKEPTPAPKIEEIVLAGYITDGKNPLDSVKVDFLNDDELYSSNQTKTTGKFYANVAKGQKYDIAISKEGYAPDTVSLDLTTPEKTLESKQKIAKGLKLQKLAPKIEEIVLAGYITDGKVPLDSVKVDFLNGDELYSSNQTKTTGKFYANVAKGQKYDIAISKEGYAPDTVSLDLTTPEKTTESTQKIAKGLKLQKIEPIKKEQTEAEKIEALLSSDTVKLEFGGGESTAEAEKKPEQLVLQGYVVGAGGALDSVDLDFFIGDKVISSKSTNQSGEFFANLEKGVVYNMSLARKGYLPDTVKVDLTTEDKIHETQVKMARTLRLMEVPQPKEKVSGTIVSEGNPLEKVNIDIYYKEQFSQYVQTSEKGTFDFDLDKGKAYNVIISKPGFIQDTLTLNLSKGDNTEELKKLLQIKLLKEPVPVEAAPDTIKVEMAFDNPNSTSEPIVKEKTTKPRAVLSNTNIGKTKDEVIEETVKEEVVDTVPKTPEPVEVLTMVIKGKILSANQPVGEAMLMLMNKGEMVSTIRSNQDGSYSFKVKREDKYSIFASKKGHRGNHVDLTTEDTKLDEVTYNIELVEHDKIMLEGFVKDSIEHPISNADVALSKESELLSKTTTEENGRFTFSVNPDEDYTVTTTAEGYFQNEEKVSTKGVKAGESVSLNVDIDDPIVVNRTVRIKNIYYDYNKAEIRNESYSELNKLVNFLQRNPSVDIELRSHTDSRGGDVYNKRLSELRALYVKQYLLIEGIEYSRIISKGYGELKPVNNCKNGVECSELEHQENRRTEFKVLSYKKEKVAKN